MHKLACLTLIFATSACPAADEGDTGDTGGSSDSSGSASSSASMSSTTATSATTASTSDSTSASTTASTSASTTASTTDSTTVTTDDSSTTDATSADSGTTDAESTGPMDACVGLPRKECTEEAGCRPISCRPYVMGNNGGVQWCLGEQEYLGCQSADIGCDDARTIACVGDDAPTYVCPDTCIPDGGMECDPPVEGMVPECP